MIPQNTYRLLVDLSLDLICIAGSDGYLKRVNPSWTRVLGWSEEELLARPIEELMHPEDRARTLRARNDLLRGFPVRGLENRYRCKDGSFRWLSWQSVLEPQSSLVFAIARDVTERRQLEQDRLVLSKLESTGILAGGIAHDFNNLLAGLLLNIEMIGLDERATAEQAFHVLQAKQTIQSAQALTLQLIAFAEGGLPVRRVTRLGPLIEECCEVALRGSTIRGTCHLARDLWPAEVDEGQFAQVIRSLVLNAREASQPGGSIQVHAENLHLTESAGLDVPVGDYLRIRIEDEGAGIPAEILPKIFDPYFSTKQRGPQKGMGLGLTICRTVIQKHGGTIFAGSRPGGGASVTCLLPARPGEAVAVVRRMPAVAGARVLVMDDEHLFREVLAGTLRQIGYDVEVAAEGDEAIALHARAAATGRPFAVVLLDLTVRGGLGGTETLAALLRRDPAVKAVLMTGYSSEATFRDSARHGFKAALAKPFPLESLRAVLAEVLTAPPAPPTPTA